MGSRLWYECSICGAKVYRNFPHPNPDRKVRVEYSRRFEGFFSDQDKDRGFLEMSCDEYLAHSMCEA